MSCTRSADIYLSGDAIATCKGNHIGVYVTYVPQLKGSTMFINKYNDQLVRCVNGKNVKLNVEFFDSKNSSLITSNIVLPSEDFANYPDRVETQVHRIDAVCDKDYAPVGIIFGPASKLAAAFKDILNKKGFKVSKLPSDNETWEEVFSGSNYTCDAEDEKLPGLYDHLITILKNLGHVEPVYPCEKKGGNKQAGGAKKDSSIKALLNKLNNVVEKL